MNWTQYASAPARFAIDLAGALVGSLGRVNLSEAHDRGLFDSVYRNVGDGAKFDQLTVDVLTDLLGDGDLCSWILRCLNSQVLDVNRVAPVLYLGSTELGHLNVRRCGPCTVGIAR